MSQNHQSNTSNSTKPSRYTITAALPYTNGPIHIGHLAGVYVPADIYTRYLRLTGKDVVFVCGSDEHGVAISMKAKKEQVTPREWRRMVHSTLLLLLPCIHTVQK